MEKWLASSRNPYRKAGEGRTTLNAQFYPTQSTAVPFIWKAPHHTSQASGEKEAGTICLLLPSNVLLGEKMSEFQAAWLAHLRVDSVWQLADLRYFLFRGGSTSRSKIESAVVPYPRKPSVIIKYSSASPEPEHEFSYYVPKANRLTPRQSQVSVLPEDDKTLSQDEVLGEAKRHRAYLLWKKHFWGTSRDVRFLERLLKLTALNSWANRSGKARWSKGVGFQPFHHGRTEQSLLPGKKTREPILAWWGPEQLYYEGEGDQAGLILLRSDCKKIGAAHQDLRTSPHRAIFSPPLVVFNRSGSVTAFADFPVVFQDKVRSISAPPKDRNLLLFLTAVIHSDLAQYFLFHTSASIAVERTTATLTEYLRLPFPRIEETRRPEKSAGIVQEAAKHLMALKSQLTALEKSRDPLLTVRREQLVADTKAALNPLVLDYYDLNSRERALLKDTVEVFRSSMTPASPWSDVPTLRSSITDDRLTYGDYLCSTLNKWAPPSAPKVQATIRISQGSGLCLITLERRGALRNCQELPEDENFSKVIARIGAAAQDKHPGVTYLRGYSLIEDTAIHVLKPLAFRHWTKTAALVDADALIGEMFRNRQ